MKRHAEETGSSLGAAIGTARVKKRQALALALGLVLVVAPIYTFPYYLDYYNPLAGGPWTAQKLVKIGWGEGLDQVGRWLQGQPNAMALRVGSEHGSAVAPFFSGDIGAVTGDALDYVVLYVKQVQAGEPSPSILRYYDRQQPAHVVSLAGIQYARVFPGPAVMPALASSAAFDTGILPKPMAYHMDVMYLPIGGKVRVDVVWMADATLPEKASRLSLIPLANLESRPEERTGAEYATAEGRLVRGADGLVVSRFELTVPDDLPRGDYGLLVDGRPLGQVAARRLDTPALKKTTSAVFGGQLELTGYTLDVSANRVTLAWRAVPRVWHDYTAFVHLLDAAGNRVGGVDGQPPFPAGGLGTREVLVMTYGEGGTQAAILPADLPAGEYRLALGWYAPDTQQRLTLPDGADVLVLPDTINIE